MLPFKARVTACTVDTNTLGDDEGLESDLYNIHLIHMNNSVWNPFSSRPSCEFMICVEVACQSFRHRFYYRHHHHHEAGKARPSTCCNGSCRGRAMPRRRGTSYTSIPRKSGKLSVKIGPATSIFKRLGCLAFKAGKLRCPTMLAGYSAWIQHRARPRW